MTSASLSSKKADLPAGFSASPLFPSLLAAAPPIVSSLWWWTVTDRLDLPKTWTGLVAASLVLVWLMRTRKGSALSPILGGISSIFVFALVFAPAEMAARVESWSLMAAGFATAAAAQQADPGRERHILSFFLTFPVLILAWLQALGVPILNSGILGFQGRRILSTLGGPDHLGWLLAGLTPWVASLALSDTPRSAPPRPARTLFRNGGLFVRSVPAAFLSGAILLAGSRSAWLATLVGLLILLILARPPVARVVWLLVAVVFGLGAALATDAMTHEARLGSRTTDLVRSTGQAAGRIYLARVQGGCLLSDLKSGRIFGRGPEGFQRTWPRCQRRYLARHPKDELFRSDLRHAHFDLAEIWTDYGLPGLLAVAWLLWILFRRQSWRLIPETAPAAASLAALAMAGLGGFPAFFAPTALLMALDLGLLLPTRRPGTHVPTTTRATPAAGSVRDTHPKPVPSPPRRTRFVLWTRAWPALTLGTLLFFGVILLTRRLASERSRCAATESRIHGRPRQALADAQRATRRDDRNPRAWIEYALDLELSGRPKEARRAWIRARRDLPSDAVISRITSLDRNSATTR